MAATFSGLHPAMVVEGEVDETAITHPQIRIRVEEALGSHRSLAEPGDDCVTDVAIRVRELAGRFNASFVPPSGWHVEMTRPSLSTARGRHAQQHVLLSRPGRRPVIIATVDAAGGQAELRRFEDASAQHRERTGLSLPMRAEDYRHVIDQVAEILARSGLEVAIRPTLRPPAPVEDGGGLGPVLRWGGIALGLAALVAAVLAATGR